MNDISKRLMPSKEKVIDFWGQTLVEKCGKFWMDVIDEGSASLKYTCFACGSETGVERCHIEPKHLGGSDTPDNIHLLCKECHIESEGIETENLYFMWFYDKSPVNSGSNTRILNLVSLYKKAYESDGMECLPDFIREALIRD